MVAQSKAPSRFRASTAHRLRSRGMPCARDAMASPSEDQGDALRNAMRAQRDDRFHFPAYDGRDACESIAIHHHDQRAALHPKQSRAIAVIANGTVVDPCPMPRTDAAGIVWRCGRSVGRRQDELTGAISSETQLASLAHAIAFAGRSLLLIDIGLDGGIHDCSSARNEV